MSDPNNKLSWMVIDKLFKELGHYFVFVTLQLYDIFLIIPKQKYRIFKNFFGFLF